MRSELPVPSAADKPYVTWMILAANIFMWVVMESEGGSENPDTLLRFGAMFGPLIAAGEYWRLFTAMFLHVGVMHLAFNGIGLIIFGRLVERVYGHLRFTIIYVLAGLCGSAASYVFNTIAIGAGASGAIFGVLGAFAGFLVARRRVLGEFGRQNLIGILVLAAINLLFGFTQPGIDNWAHMGGLAGGLVLGYVMAPRYRRREQLSPLGYSYNLVDINPLRKSAWVVPLVAAVVFAGVWFGTATQSEQAAAETHVFRAERFIDQGSYPDALAELNRAISLDKTNARAYYLRGKVLAEAGTERDRRRARSDLSAAIRMGLDPESRRDAVSLLITLGSQ